MNSGGLVTLCLNDRDGEKIHWSQQKSQDRGKNRFMVLQYFKVEQKLFILHGAREQC